MQQFQKEVNLKNVNSMVEDLFKQFLENQNSTELMDRKQVCNMLSISTPTLMKYEREGIIPSFSIGSRIRFKKSDVLNSLKQINEIKYRRV